jgi:hypothetical protein
MEKFHGKVLWKTPWKTPWKIPWKKGRKRNVVGNSAVPNIFIYIYNGTINDYSIFKIWTNGKMVKRK